MKLKQDFGLRKDYKLLNIAYRQRKNLKKCREALYRYQKKYLKLAEKIKQADNNGVYECFDAAAEPFLTSLIK